MSKLTDDVIYKFIVLEGINGSGKTSVGKKLSNDTLLELIQVADKEFALAESIIERQNENTKLMYYYARNFCISNYVKEAKCSNGFVCCRYFYSTMVYHSFFSGCSISDTIDMMGQINKKLIYPDLLVYLSANDDIIVERLKQRIKPLNKMESIIINDNKARKTICELFLELCETMSKNISYIVVDSSKTLQETYENVIKELSIGCKNK